jgi:Kdo2-lipid IVA lauroyltransferase/acyltransferase
MIRLTYYFFYTLSLLPLWVLYGLADFFYLILFYIVGYRKEVVWKNLKNSFPEKGDAALKLIRRRFYRCFMQNWIETIKLMSISQKSLDKRMTANWDAVEQLYEKHPRIQILLGHCFNWEWGCANASLHQPYLLLPVYLLVSNKAMDELFIKIRSRFGAKPVRAGEMARHLLPFRNTKYMLALLADQSPPGSTNAYWVNFMHQPTAFLKGPERNARAANVPVVYLGIRRLKRGYYHIHTELFCEHPADTKEGELTKRYAQRLEQEIIATPHTYLWSHKRWKIKWDKKYEKGWVDPLVKMPRE